MTKPYPTIEEVEKRVGMRARSWRYAWPADIIRHICDLDREREAPAEDRIDWAAIPNASHVAKDATEQAYAYLSEPFAITSQWAPTSFGTMAIDATIPGPWQDSLRARPGNV